MSYEAASAVVDIANNLLSEQFHCLTVSLFSFVQYDVNGIMQLVYHLQSAALGLAIAGALALGYSNIFVTAPTPENLRTLFEFIFKVRLLLHQKR